MAALNLDMTLREFFELAERVGNAAQTIREAQAMLGAPVPVPLRMTHPSDAARNVDFDRAPPPPSEPDYRSASRADVLLTNKGPVVLTDTEKAVKERLRIEREAAEMAAESHLAAQKLGQPS